MFLLIFYVIKLPQLNRTQDLLFTMNISANTNKTLNQRSFTLKRRTYNNTLTSIVIRYISVLKNTHWERRYTFFSNLKVYFWYISGHTVSED